MLAVRAVRTEQSEQQYFLNLTNSEQSKQANLSNSANTEQFISNLPEQYEQHPNNTNTDWDENTDWGIPEEDSNWECPDIN